MSYSRWTYDSPNPLVRFAHRSRFRIALKLIRIRPHQSLLDFGCGDGMFLNRLAGQAPEGVELVGFEPYMDACDGNRVPIHKDWDRVRAIADRRQGFDLVTCFEVLEHLPQRKLGEALDRIRAVSKPETQVFVSVPIESGFPSVVKNTIRHLAYNKEHGNIYSLKNIARSALSMPMPECRQDDYCMHMGFYYRDLEERLAESFAIVKRQFSPFPGLGAGLNSQVFYELRLLPGPAARR